MRPALYIAAIALALTWACGSLSWCADRYDYDIADYTATFEVLPDTTDVAITLDILYRIGGTDKSDGFKYVGKHTVEGLVCQDGTGERLRSQVVTHKETRVSWEFPPVKNCPQRITARFTLKNLLQRNRGKATLKVDWAGVFRIPVGRATFVVIFPEGHDMKDFSANPGEWTKKNQDGKWSIEMTQAPLKERGFVVSFQN